jgi:hypothetical protein
VEDLRLPRRRQGPRVRAHPDWTHTREITKAETADHTGSFSRGFSPKNLLRTSAAQQQRCLQTQLCGSTISGTCEAPSAVEMETHNLSLSLSLSRALSLFLSRPLPPCPNNGPSPLCCFLGAPPLRTGPTHLASRLTAHEELGRVQCLSAAFKVPTSAAVTMLADRQRLD